MLKAPFLLGAPHLQGEPLARDFQRFALLCSVAVLPCQLEERSQLQVDGRTGCRQGEQGR